MEVEQVRANQEVRDMKEQLEQIREKRWKSVSLSLSSQTDLLPGSSAPETPRTPKSIAKESGDGRGEEGVFGHVGDRRVEHRPPFRFKPFRQTPDHAETSRERWTLLLRSVCWSPSRDLSTSPKHRHISA